jgi:hypothetical protein
VRFLSYSQLWDFWTCPRLSTYRQQPQLRRQSPWQQASVRKGTRVHHFLHQATVLSDVEQKKSPAFQQFISDYPQIWSSYQQLIAAHNGSASSECVLDVPLPGDWNLPYVLTGRLDRLIAEQQQALILDWKTGQFKDAESARLQLRFYAWLVWLARETLPFPVAEVIAEAHYLESKHCERWALTPENSAAETSFFYDLLHDYHRQQIRASEGIPNPRSTSEGLWCTMCEYQRLCPEGRYHAE